MLCLVLCIQALPHGVRGDGVISMIRMPLGDSIDRPVTNIKMLMGKSEVTINSLAQVDDGDERVCSLVRACRPVEDIDKLDGLLW